MPRLRRPGDDRFAAIDFETVNPRPDSARALGLGIVSGGRVGERLYHRIRPTARAFSFTGVHGLPTVLLPFVCAVGVVRQVWTIRQTRRPDVCARRGIAVRYHHGEFDAEACARIMIAAAAAGWAPAAALPSVQDGGRGLGGAVRRARFARAA